MLDALQEYDFPVCFGFPAGHGPVNKALVLGVTVQLTVKEQGAKISFKYGGR